MHHPIIEQIKQECWDGQDKNRNDFGAPYASTVDGIQKQIDAIKHAGIVFVWTNDGKLEKYIVEKK